MEINPDDIVYWQWGVVKLNATIVFTWATMAVWAAVAVLVRFRARRGRDVPIWQHALEAILERIRTQIEEASGRDPSRYLPFIGTLFLVTATANLLNVLPGFEAPTASITTTAAWSFCVLAAIPIYGIEARGFWGYLGSYMEPTPVMLPFNIITEFSRILALAVRLFGNILSGGLVVALIVSLAPLFFPVVMQSLELLIGLVQAYVFALLALVFITSAEKAQAAV